MASNFALYRKYRSQNFDTVIGQPHIVETLTAAISKDHLSHAYLFTGPRGVGKTTVARLLAKALNCLGDPKPCNQCSQCQIDLSSSMDLIEIDAASNRRIDEIRELRDKIGLAPASGRFKVYIIDEVHMLTNEAFNALLKTLEEPPAHAVFILATTEAHKLPETIISRTQRFNFKPLSPSDAAIGLAYIAKKEQIKIEPEAITLLATAARGSLRDGISMLDQVASSGLAPITTAVVNRILGWGEDKFITNLSRAIIEGQALAALTHLDSIAASGVSINQIISQLINRWRIILLAAAGMSSKTDDDLTNEAKSQLTILQIAAIIDALMAASKSSWPTLALESALVKLTMLDEPASPPSPNTFSATHPTIDLVGPTTSKSSHAAPQQPSSLASDPSQSLPAQAQNQSISNLSQDHWPHALRLIQRQNNPLFALLSTCQPRFSSDSLEVICQFSFHRDRLQEPRNRQLIETALDEAYGRPIKVSARVEPKTAQAPAKIDTSSELVSSALEILGGEVVDG